MSVAARVAVGGTSELGGDNHQQTETGAAVNLKHIRVSITQHKDNINYHFRGYSSLTLVSHLCCHGRLLRLPQLRF